MKSERGLITLALAASLAGCGYAAQGAPAHTASPSASPSAAATAPATPSPEATPAVRTYTNTAGAYSLQYPATWFAIPDAGISNDFPSVFSNENVQVPPTIPQIGTPNNVLLTVGRDPTIGGCSIPSDFVVSTSDTMLGGEPAKRDVVNEPPGWGSSDHLYRIRVEGVHRNHCWAATFDSRTQAARDGSAATDDQIIASFNFLD
jgi:hypothetical protein